MSDEQEQEEVETEEPEAEEPEVVVAPPPRKPPPPKKKVGVGVPVRKWENREVELLWPEILARYKANGKSTYGIDIRVQRVSPPPAVSMGSLNGGAVLGDRTRNPGDALIRYVDDYFHIPSGNPNEAVYDVYFFDRNEGPGLIARGTLTRPTIAEIMAVRRAANQQPPVQQQGYGAPPQEYAPQGYPQAPGYPPQVHPAWHQPPPGYGAPPYYPPAPQAPQGPDPRDRIIAQLFDHLKQNGVAPPPGVPAAPPPASPPPQVHPAWQQPPGYAAPPPPPVPADPMAARRQMVADMRELKNLHEELTTMFGGTIGTGAPVDVQEEAPEPPPKPEDMLKFAVIEIPGTGNAGMGKPSWKFAQDKQSGDVDWKGSLFANAEQLQPIAEKVIDMFTKLVNKMGQTENVSQIQAPAQLYAAPAAAPNGAPDVGWPKS